MLGMACWRAAAVCCVLGGLNGCHGATWVLQPLHVTGCSLDRKAVKEGGTCQSHQSFCSILSLGYSSLQHMNNIGIS